jgi:hypothetical protein
LFKYFLIFIEEDVVSILGLLNCCLNCDSKSKYLSYNILFSANIRFMMDITVDDYWKNPGWGGVIPEQVLLGGSAGYNQEVICEHSVW